MQIPLKGLTVYWEAPQRYTQKQHGKKRAVDVGDGRDFFPLGEPYQQFTGGSDVCLGSQKVGRLNM